VAQKKKNFIGLRYGKFTVLENINKDSKTLNRTFLCMCSCGRKKVRSYPQLKKNKRGCEVCTKATQEQLRISKYTAPEYHFICGKKIDTHEKCKRCTILLCEKTNNKDVGGFCPPCAKEDNIV